ncbi:MAG: YraN family protein [Bacteroidales bacterium]|jgi:putative endonuclease|nr:YraN family protein [Bacteroidales bacterium]MDD2264665.1 YraN family protein [Bacteroidales bacterium]MDD2832231.1 YraN family protein [Bacteroidales bacterium]MDD3209108.1 YraN family protein [Bacteroidales bacterium]MDD3697884.1 YraN family protein [Bacteroidales bacterium]
MKGRKRDTWQTGRKGEILAGNFLKRKGFRILHTNWRTGHKELDIVADKADKIHFIEVRSRSRIDVVSPEQTIDRIKQQMVMAAARNYMARYHIRAEAQFDVIAIVFGPAGTDDPNYELKYIPNAFTLLL